MLQRAASNAYSWWWASHIRTKQSKWLDNNLQDMEERVKSMLKIIEEDADSFAKRAEMYYKRRPELIISVEEAYRAYRALAERYDHLSGELHKANHTIAAAFPDLQFGMQDEDDDNSPRAISGIDPAKIPLPPPVIPHVGFGSKIRKKAAAATKPQLKRVSSEEKNKAQEEIDKLQKKILVLQTEKEFIKSSYQSGLAKFWDIEQQVAEMQEEVCKLQDEFSASAVIQDDEARALMAATALRSCEDTLLNLQEEQKRSSELARIESRRIKDAKEKLRSLKGESQGEIGQVTGDNTDPNLYADVEEERYDLKQQSLELESICEKVKEHFHTSSDTTVSELAEKIDELVNKVISLEITVSSQTVQIDTLRSETDELHKHLQILEEEKLSVLGDPSTLTGKLKRAEEELHRIQDLEKHVHDEKKTLRNQFSEACHSLDDLSEKLQSPKSQDIRTVSRRHSGEEVIPSEDNTTFVAENNNTNQEPGSGAAQTDEDIQKDKLSMLGNSSTLVGKLQQAEEEIHRTQDIEKHIHDEKKTLRNQFTEACHSLDDHSEKLQSPKSQDIDMVSRRQSGEEVIPSEYNTTFVAENSHSIKEPGIGLNEASELIHPAVGASNINRPGETVTIDQDFGVKQVEDDFIKVEAPEAQITTPFLMDKDPQIFESQQIEATTSSIDTAKKTSSEEVPLQNDRGSTHQGILHFLAHSDDGNISEEPSCTEVTSQSSRETNLIYQEAIPIPKIGLLCKDDAICAEGSQISDSSFSNNSKEDMLQAQADSGSHLINDPTIQNQSVEDNLDLQQLLLNGLEDREKILLAEYTSILRSYKEAKKKLAEAEKMNEGYQFEMTTQIGELKTATVMKDEEIRLLREKLNSLQGSSGEGEQVLEVEDPSHYKLESNALPRLMAVSSSSRKLFSRGWKNRSDKESRMSISFNVAELDGPLAEDGIKLVHIGELPVTSALEEKFRRDIDTVLEENLDFWLRFSTTFHSVQKFQDIFEELQAEMDKLKESRSQEGSSSNVSEHSRKSESGTIEQQLREFKTELQVWTEQNAMLRDELKKRFTSLCSIQEEISSALNSSEAKDKQFTPYQAAKFQGEVLNMQQENNKVADELKLGLDHVKMFQGEVDKALGKLHKGFDLPGSRGTHHHYHFRHFSSKTRVPLRNLLFGVKPKKQSMLACVNPALQKHQSEL